MSGYTVVTSPRARRISITVRRDGSVRVAKPRWVSTRTAEEFVRRSERWIMRARAHMDTLPKTSRIESSKQEYKKYKHAALELLERRVRHFNAHYRLHYGRIVVRNQKSRWGSCSRSGNLSFNYRLALLPPELADYVVVHELCHLREMNHSKRFWALVAETIPEHKDRRKALVRFGRGLLVE